MAKARFFLSVPEQFSPIGKNASVAITPPFRSAQEMCWKRPITAAYTSALHVHVMTCHHSGIRRPAARPAAAEDVRARSMRPSPAKIPSHTVRTPANARRFLRLQHTIYEPQAGGSSAVIEYVTHPTAPYPGASIGRRRNPGTKKAKLAKLRARPGATRARRG